MENRMNADSFEYARDRLGRAGTYYGDVAPMIEYLFACLEDIGELNVNGNLVDEAWTAVSEIDEWLYERLEK